MAKAEMIEIAIFPSATAQRHDHAVHQRDPDRHAAEAAAEALDQDPAGSFSNRWRPGSSGNRRRASMVAWSWVEATKVIQTGKAMMITPRISTRWLINEHDRAVLDHQ